MQTLCARENPIRNEHQLSGIATSMGKRKKKKKRLWEKKK